MSEATPRPAENGSGPEGDRVRPVSARPGARPEDAVRPPGPGPRGPKGQGRPSGPPPQERERKAPAPRPEPPPEVPDRPAEEPVRLTVEGAEWVVRAVGQGSSGRSPGGSAPLVLLIFAPADRPDDPTREILCIGRAAERFSEHELEALFRKARPFSRSPRKQSIFTDTRGGKKDR